MAHKLEKFYSSFGGVDTRSNKLLMDPTTFRNGSKNFRYNFQDEIQNANGFQHKDSGAPSFVKQFEYKFNDVNTGEAKVQILAVGLNGHLYRRKSHTLHFITHGVATSCSVFYNEVTDKFEISLVGIGSIEITDAMTLDQLKTALNALAGVSVSILDDDGNSVVSTKLAYLMDCVIENNFKDNPVYFWEMVPFPDVTCVSATPVTIANFNIADPTQYTINSVPFKTTVALYGKDEYEGISSINHGNSIYITDGAFPLKYDGKCVYRAGVPKVVLAAVSSRTINIPPFGDISSYENVTGIAAIPVNPITGTAALADGAYKYKERFAFTDFNGVTTYGDIVEDVIASPINPLPITGSNYEVRSRGFWYGKDFPIFACKVDGVQGSGINGGGVTINVHAGHNILPGMVIRQSTSVGAPAPAIRSTSKSIINFNALVTAVTETTITLAETVCSAGDLVFTSAFNDFEILNGYFTQNFYINKRPLQYYSSSNIAPVGAFLQVFRSKVGATDGPSYHVANMPLPFVNGDKSVMIDDRTDNTLEENLLDAGEGSELPRACKYLTKWQGNLVQAGRPADPTIQNDNYPSIFFVDTPLNFCQESIEVLSHYTEALLCDMQSIYWADANTPEGFPQDGLHEFLIETEESDRVKGVAPNKDAIIAFKEFSTGIVTGDVSIINSLALEILEDDIGLASHNTIAQVKGSTVWLDTSKGFYSLVAGRLPVHIGYPISDYQQINAQKLNYNMAVACNSRDLNMYICAAGSTWFVFDYSDIKGGGTRNCWYIWERMSAQSLLYTSKGETLVYAGGHTWKVKNTNTRFDFTDHKSAIQMDGRIAWINFGAPTIDKHFEKVWVNSIQGGFDLTVDQYVNYLEDQVASKIVGLPETPKKTVKEWIPCAIPKVSALSVGFKNAQKNQFVRIQGFEIEWSADFDVGEPKR